MALGHESYERKRLPYISWQPSHLLLNCRRIISSLWYNYFHHIKYRKLGYGLAKKVESNKSIAVWGFGILFGIVLPLFSDKFRLIHRVWMVGFFLFLVNMLFSIWLGQYIKKNGLKWWNLLVFPVLYLLVSSIFMPKYTVYFALFYLGVTYLAWSISSQS